MFYRAGLAVFDASVPALKHCYSMFAFSGLKVFSSEVALLSNGDSMFFQNFSLSSFSSPLPSLTNGNKMFNGCKLNLESVQTIARTIKDNNLMATPPTLTLGMVKGIQGQVDAELDLIRAKGWALTAQYN